MLQILKILSQRGIASEVPSAQSSRADAPTFERNHRKKGVCSRHKKSRLENSQSHMIQSMK